MKGLPSKTLGLALLALVVLPRTASAQVPPTVLPFIDLKCYGLTAPDGTTLPPLGFPIDLVEHLNPLLIQFHLPPEHIVLLDPFQLCVPVAKNGLTPPPDALRFIQFIDLKCYHVQADPPGPLNLFLGLKHMNPVLMQSLPPEQQIERVVLQEAQKLCVPVLKSDADGNPVVPPTADVFAFVQFIDQKCYGMLGPDGQPLPPLGFPIHLDHLNPVFSDLFGAPPEDVVMQDPQQLCVPVKKNGQSPPPPDLRVIEQIDLKCYGIQGDPLFLPQTLFHINPVLRPLLPPEQVLVQEPQQLCVPVTKQSTPGGRAAPEPNKASNAAPAPKEVSSAAPAASNKGSRRQHSR